MSCWGVLWPTQPSDSVLLSVAIAVEQLHFKTPEELRSKVGEAPELPASGGGARREEEPKLRWVAAVGGRRRSCGEWGRAGAGRAARRPAVPGEEFGRRRRWLGMLVPTGETATNRSGKGLDKGSV
jgi:hypothetical protein